MNIVKIHLNKDEPYVAVEDGCNPSMAKQSKLDVNLWQQTTTNNKEIMKFVAGQISESNSKVIIFILKSVMSNTFIEKGVQHFIKHDKKQNISISSIFYVWILKKKLRTFLLAMAVFSVYC